MDVKALAKSKRAHSQHHSKRPHGSHQNLKLKPSPSGGSNDASTGKNLLGKQVNEKAHRPKGSPALPSNWDRYDDEELDAGSEGVSLDSSGKTSDVILPKSKGADYRHLLAEAQSQENASLDGVTSLDDVLSGMSFASPLRHSEMRIRYRFVALLDHYSLLSVVSFRH